MKFNDHELSLYAAARLGKADKEGCLWMREVEGKIRKKQSKLYSPAIILTYITPVFCTVRLCAEMVSVIRKSAVLLQNRDTSKRHLL